MIRHQPRPAALPPSLPAATGAESAEAALPTSRVRVAGDSYRSLREPGSPRPRAAADDTDLVADAVTLKALGRIVRRYEAVEVAGAEA